MNEDFFDKVKQAEELDEEIEHQSEVLKAYGKRFEAKPLDRALAILRRYNLPWGIRTRPCPQEPPEYVKSVSNPKAERYMRAALGYPALYRLNFIKQLSTLCYSRKLDASHHRLPHALGTAEVAGMLLEAVERELPGHKVSQVELDDADWKAVILYALVHDCYHGPMGHSLELMDEVLAYESYRKLDKHFLRQDLLNAGDVSRLVSEIAENDAEAEKIHGLLKFFVTSDEPNELRDEKFFLLQIVDSHLDADRIDYLLRDALHLGQAVLDKNSWIDVLMSARVASEPDEPGNEPRKRKMLAYPREYESRIEEILSLRHRFHVEYYEHPSRLALDEMICHLIYYYFEDMGLPKDPKGSTEILAEFMKLTDANLFPFLMEVENPSRHDRPWYPREMMNDVLTNRHYLPVWSLEIAAEKWDALLKEFNQVSERIGKEQRRLLQENFGETHPDDSIQKEYRKRAIKSVWGSKDEQVQDEVMPLLYAFLCDRSFPFKLSLERELWLSMLEREEVRTAWERISRMYYGSDDPSDEFKDYPLVHISRPLYLKSPTKKEATEIVREFQTGMDPKEPQTEKVLCYDQQGQSAWLKPAIRYSPKKFCPFRIVISAQYDLSRMDGIGEMAKESFLGMIRELKWLDS
jgi:HD superfamily phosphohydrolase